MAVKPATKTKIRRDIAQLRRIWALVDELAEQYPDDVLLKSEAALGSVEGLLARAFFGGIQQNMERRKADDRRMLGKVGELRREVCAMRARAAFGRRAPQNGETA